MAPRAESTYGIDRMDNEDDGSSSFAKKQQQAPVEGVSVGFADLTYEVPLQGKAGKGKNNNDGADKPDEDKLTILHPISGSFLPGKMIALMGPR